MNEEWFIDGWNVIHDLAVPHSSKRPSASRKIVLSELFSNLAGFAAAGSRKILVVLDGVGDNNEFRAYKTESLEIVYSGKIDADSVIEKSLYEARGRAVLFVVTRDRGIRQMALGAGAHVLSPKDFLERIQQDRKQKEDILFRHQVKAHRFNRPFDDPLKKFDPPSK